jgi:APA family basic amino acid/polyamine antiporter
MSTAAEEAEDGKKHMPRAIVLSLVIAMVLYVAATLVPHGMQSYQRSTRRPGFASAFTSGRACRSWPASSRRSRCCPSSP